MPPCPGLGPRRAPHSRLPSLLVAAALAILGALTLTARSVASPARFTPAAGDLVQTPRPCPATAPSSAYDATCWTVREDPGDPLDLVAGGVPWGQCTYWALEERPDLWNHRSTTDPDLDDWVAYTWATHAAREGVRVDHRPAAGAILVWPRTSTDPTGHVAYVDSVTGETTAGNELVRIDELNDTLFDDPSRGQGDTITLPMTATELAGVQVIHRPPTADGRRS